MHMMFYYSACSINTDLAGLVEEVLNKQLPKPSGVRCGNWEARPLSQKQKLYAALDVFASLLIHHELQNQPLQVTASQKMRDAMFQKATTTLYASFQ
jgi:ribonuclease D